MGFSLLVYRQFRAVSKSRIKINIDNAMFQNQHSISRMTFHISISRINFNIRRLNVKINIKNLNWLKKNSRSIFKIKNFKTFSQNQNKYQELSWALFKFKIKINSNFDLFSKSKSRTISRIKIKIQESRFLPISDTLHSLFEASIHVRIERWWIMSILAS